MAIFTGELKNDWWKWALIALAVIALYKGITGGLSDAFKRIIDPLGVGDKADELQKQAKKVRQAKLDYIKKISTPKNVKYGIGKTYEQAKANALAIANMMYSNLKGVSTDSNHLKVYGYIKAIRNPYDMKLIFKQFGLRKGQNLADWILNESMDQDMKDEMLTKLTRLISV